MAVQNPFFGKREPESPLMRASAQPLPGGTSMAASVATGQAAPASTQAKPGRTDSGGSKLTVGPNIKLKGVEITDCDTLVVEGTVEATMDSRVIQIAQQGAFKGSCEVDLAEIYGTIDGNLTVRQKLVIHATGKVTGRIRYGKIVIEEGGQLSGDVECAANGAAKASSSGTKPSMQLAA